MKRRLPGFPDFLRVIALDSCPSTNDFVKENQKELGGHFPLLVHARSQTAGHGRSGRSWLSVPGKGLYCTFAFHFPARARLQLLSLTAGVAVASMLRDVSGREFALKWPNDVQYQGRKIAGILCENILSGENAVSIVGIGINIGHAAADFPGPLRDNAVSLAMVTGVAHELDALYPLLAEAFFHWLQLLQSGGGEVIEASRELSRGLLGQGIEFHDGSQLVSGTFAGIDAEGGLILRSAPGEERTYYNGEIRRLT